MAKLAKVNARGQVSLGSAAQYEYYLVTVDPDGTIHLVPATVQKVNR
jgi:hypothetical protein